MLNLLTLIMLTRLNLEEKLEKCRRNKRSYIFIYLTIKLDYLDLSFDPFLFQKKRKRKKNLLLEIIVKSSFSTFPSRISTSDAVFFVLHAIGFPLDFSTFTLVRSAARYRRSPTFHHRFSRYRARKVAKTCWRISSPLSRPLSLVGTLERIAGRFAFARFAMHRG